MSLAVKNYHSSTILVHVQSDQPRAMASLHRLPCEILFEISSYLSIKDNFSLLLTSRTLNRALDSEFYGHVTRDKFSTQLALSHYFGHLGSTQKPTATGKRPLYECIKKLFNANPPLDPNFDGLWVYHKADGSDWEGTLLAAAVENGFDDVVNLALERGADINRYSAGGSPLARAVYFGKRKTAELLMEKGADVHSDLWGMPVLALVGWMFDFKAFKQMIKDGVDVNWATPPNEDGARYTALHCIAGKMWFSAHYYKYHLIRYLLRHGADPNAYIGPITNATATQPTAFLQLLAENSTYESYQVDCWCDWTLTNMLQHGADAGAYDYSMSAPIMLAIKCATSATQCGPLRVIKQLVKRAGKEILHRQYGAQRITPLMAAVTRPNVPIVKYLLRQNVDVNVANEKGWTAALCAEMAMADLKFGRKRAGEDRVKLAVYLLPGIEKCRDLVLNSKGMDWLMHGACWTKWMNFCYYADPGHAWDE